MDHVHRRIIGAFALSLSFSLSCRTPLAEAAEPVPPPVVSGVEVNQAGASLVSIRVLGRHLPRPQVIGNNGSDIELFFAETAIPSGVWSRDYDFPLLRQTALTTEEGGLRMILTTGEPLEVAAVAGGDRSGTVEIALKKHGGETGPSHPLDVVLPLPSESSDPMTKTTPVNLELRGVELRDVFRMLGKIVDKNLIVDPSVPSDSVTMSLKGVPLNQAFAYLMRMYGISYAIMGDTIIVGTPANLGKTMGLEKTQGYQIAYADPQKAPGLLQGLAGIDQAVVDERLRTIYVTGRPEQLSDVERALRRIDHPGRQIMLQARIMEVKDNGKKELETLLEGVYKHWWFNYGAGGGAIGYVYDNKPEEEIYKPLTGEKRPIGPRGFDLKDIAGGTFRMLDAGLKALVEENKGKVLASPSVIAIDGQKAVIKLVEKYKYISERDEAGNPSYDEEEVGPQLEFTPLLGRGGIITVDLKISTGSVIGTYKGGQGEEFPQTSSREVMTKIRVRDGEPFVVGGLFSEENRTTVSKIPVLGDIPLLGEIFRSRSTEKNKSEVVMVVVPYVLDVPDADIEMVDF